VTPPEAIKAANIINRSENLRCMNCTADFSNHSVAGRWLISPFPLLDPYDCYYVDHSGLVEIADSICKRSWDAKPRRTRYTAGGKPSGRS